MAGFRSEESGEQQVGLESWKAVTQVNLFLNPL